MTQTTEKKEGRKCLYCEEQFPASKRADAKFCSNSCKAWHWQELRKLKKKELDKKERELKELIKKLVLARLAADLAKRKVSFFKRLSRRLFTPQRTLFF